MEQEAELVGAVPPPTEGRAESITAKAWDSQRTDNTLKGSSWAAEGGGDQEINCTQWQELLNPSRHLCRGKRTMLQFILI